MSDFSQTPQQRDFHCPSCNGRIVIPFSLPSTTGPCPHCQATITSPPPPEAEPHTPAAAAVAPGIPVPPPPSNESTPDSPPIASEQMPAPSQNAPAIPERRDGAETQITQPAPAIPKKKKGSSGIIPAMLGLFALILAGGGAVYYLSNQMGNKVDPPNLNGSPEDQEIKEANYIRIGWQKDAFEVLDKYLTGTSVDSKLPYVRDGAALRPKMESFYGGVEINDSDTPADSFSIQELSEEDRKRGIFMLTYDQPPQFALKEFFRPLASLEVQYGIDEADILLSTMARVSNFAMEPVRVHAFFKRVNGELKLDWEVFAQTKYRIFRNFVELPDIGQSETFRVLIVEDVPDKGQGVVGARTYRLADPANITDSARVNVKLDSEIGRALSIINWRGTKQTTPITRTATVELEWTGSPDSPTLDIKRFICWEFLGLGGKEIPSNAAN
ncbi:hypothetical protein ACFSSA_13060 [Luteolibacter algae]|uniref:Uncharacterized protein n=1 Tax=Luteolibacter algae TaxID=454151 RepID=A0ABW5DA42_9BACT